MKVQCPNCGKPVVVNGLGRKRLNIPLRNVCESLEAHCNVAAAAQELNCSEAYIFKVLKDKGLKPKDVINNRAKYIKILGGCHSNRADHL